MSGRPTKLAPQTTPPAFAKVLREGAGSIVNTSNRAFVLNAANAFGENGAFAAKAEAIFAPLVFNGVSAPSSGSEVSKYGQNLDLNKPYEARVVPIFQDFVTAQILNGTDNFLLDVVSPAWETPELNFTVNRTEYNAIMFNNIAEFGIPDMQTKFNYGWTDGTKLFALATEISRDLAMDPNFGAQVWIEELNQFISNANLTVNGNIITSVVHIGYQNMTQNKALNKKMDHIKLYQAESEDVLMMAEDPLRVLVRLARLREKIPGLNMLITPAGGSQYTTEIRGESVSMLAQKLITDAENDRVLVEFSDGPRSAKTITIGNAPVHVVEFTPFRINMQTEILIDPLLTHLTICQYYPPNPFNKALTALHNVDPGRLDRIIWYQNKTMGRNERVTLPTMLEACIYWEPTEKGGDVSATAKGFAAHMTQRLKSGQYEDAPYDWNQTLGHFSKDINAETVDNNKPVSMAELSGKTDLRSMKSWRQHFCGLLYLPDVKQFVVPELFGDFHCFNLTNEQVHDAAIRVATAMGHSAGAAEGQGLAHLESSYQTVRRFKKGVKGAKVEQPYVQGLINKNIGRMLDTSGDTSTLKTERTPAYKKDRFPNIALLDEWLPNRFGGMDLPDKTGQITSTYPAGFGNGVGVRTLAAEALNGKTLWGDASHDADEILTFAKRTQKDMGDFIGKTGYTAKKLTPPWVHHESSLTRLIDYLLGAEGPLFLGVPRNARYSADLAGGGPGLVRASPVLSGNEAILKATQALTIAEIARLQRTKTVVQVSALARAMACVKASTQESFFTMLDRMTRLGGAGDRVFATEFATIVHGMCDYIIGFCDYFGENPVDSSKIQASSVIMDAFVAALYGPLGDIDDITETLNDLARNANAVRRESVKSEVLAAGRKFSANFATSSSMREFYQSLPKPVAPVGELKGYVEELRAYEKTFASATVSVQEGVIGRGGGGGGGGEAEPVASGFEGVYTDAPLRYLRTPLTNSRGFDDYLARTPVPWVIPGDPDVFYQAPLDVIHRAGGSGGGSSSAKPLKSKMNARPIGAKNSLTSLSKNLFFQSQVYGNSNLSCDAKGSKKKPYRRPDEEEMRVEEVDDDDDLLFSPLRSKKSTAATRPLRTKKSAMDVDALLGFDLGVPFQEDEDDMRTGGKGRGGMAGKISLDESGDMHYDRVMRSTYRGPWMKRIKYRNANIKSKLIRFIFMSILEAKNNLKTPVNLAKAGAQLFDVVVVRPFTELRTHAMVALESGSGTLNTTLGHASVTVAKESRGKFHINCNFIMGIVRVNPENIALIPHAFPHSWIGGRKVDFMTNFDNFNLPNPGKESCIALLVPATEIITASPIHLRQEETYVRPGIDDAIWERKYSACGDWYDYLLREQNPASVDASHMRRANYSLSVPISHVGNLGPCSYIDPHTGKQRDVAGVGPLGSWPMNMEGCVQVYEGRSVKFPDVIQKYAYEHV